MRFLDYVGRGQVPWIHEKPGLKGQQQEMGKPAKLNKTDVRPGSYGGHYNPDKWTWLGNAPPSTDGWARNLESPPLGSAAQQRPLSQAWSQEAASVDLRERQEESVDLLLKGTA